MCKTMVAYCPFEETESGSCYSKDVVLVMAFTSHFKLKCRVLITCSKIVLIHLHVVLAPSPIH